MATINAADANWEGDLRRCHEDLGMKGGEAVPRNIMNSPWDGPEARKVVSACAERGLPVFLPHRIEDVRQRHWMDPRTDVGPRWRGEPYCRRYREQLS